MYAILAHGGHQYRVTAGDRLLVDRLPAEVGSVVSLEPVLLVSDGDKVDVGTPAVEGCRVAATVVSHRRGKKLRVFTYKAKKRRRRTLGHRSELTELVVEKVLAKGEKLPEKGEHAAAPRKAAAASAKVDTKKVEATTKSAAEPVMEKQAASAKAQKAGDAEAKSPAKKKTTSKPATADEAVEEKADTNDGA